MSDWEDMPDSGWEDTPEQPQRAMATPMEAALSAASNQIQNVGEGLSMGFRDEGEAALSGLYDDRPYEERLRAIEQRRAIDTIGNEGWATAAKVAGGLGTGALGGAAIAPKTIVGTGATLAGEGLIAGAGTSDATLFGDPQQLATDMAVGGAVGVAAGAAAGTVANVAYRALSPTAKRVSAFINGMGKNARETTHAANLKTAKELKIPTTAPERLADEGLMAKQARYQSDEILQNAVNPTLGARTNRVNQIAREEIGLPPADDINRKDLGIAAKSISDKFKSIEGDYPTATLTDDLMTRLDDVVSAKSIVKPPEKAVTAVNRTMEMLDEGMTGKQYLQQRSLIDKEIQAIYKSDKPDVRLAETYSEIVDILDDTFSKGLNSESNQILQNARRQWKNLKLLDQPNAVMGGDVNLSKVKTGLNKNKSFLRGSDQSSLARVADLADSTKFNFGRSGTSERSPFNLLQKAQSTLEMPFANAVIDRGGMLGLRASPGASTAGGGAASSLAPPVVLGTEDRLSLQK